MSAYVELQDAEFAAEAAGYTATRHQREVGTGYFDEVAQVIAFLCSDAAGGVNGEAITVALGGLW